MATEQTAPEKIKVVRAGGTSTLDLYRAALGPVRTDYYLKAFTRFDAAGRAGTSWNWSAALLTFNWLAFRKLWARLWPMWVASCLPHCFCWASGGWFSSGLSKPNGHWPAPACC